MIRSHSDSQSPPSDLQGARKRARVACNQCRQAKIRCDLKQIPCPRCTRLGLGCTVDSSYRRTNRRDEVKKLQQQVENLQNVIGNGPEAEDPTTFHSSPARTPRSSRGVPVLGYALNASSVHELATPSTVSVRATELNQEVAQESPLSVRALGDTTVTRCRAQFMFTTYFKCYHRFLPILNARTDEQTCYETSPLLFWSIISVSARQLQAEVDFLTEIAPALTRLLWETVATGALKLPQIQALLLLSCWPLPNVRLWTDKSILLSNMALTSAMQIGLHRPGCEIEYARDSSQLTASDVEERFCTWIAAAVIETNLLSVSLEVGQGPSPHFDDWSIRDASKVPAFVDIPSEIRYGLMIQKCSYEATLRLSKSAEGPYGMCGGDTGFEIIWQCEQLYDHLQTLQAQLSLSNWLELQFARLHIQCLYLLYDGQQTDAQRAGILRAYSTASEIITTVLSDDKSHDILPFAPLRVSRIIVTAAVLLLRVLHSTSAAGLDYKHGKLLVHAAAFSLRQFSVLQKGQDQPGRASEMLRAFWRVAERSPTMSSQDINLRAKSRMGASLVYDCLFRFRDKTVTATASNVQTGPAPPLDFPPERSNNETIGGSQMPVPSLPLPDPTVFPEDILNFNPEIDLANMSWLGDIGYPGFADMETW